MCEQVTESLPADLAQIAASDADLVDHLASDIEFDYVNSMRKSIVDYILITKFDFQAEKTQQKIWHSVPSLKDATTPRTILVKNDFPYYTPSNIVHYILWKIKEDLTVDEIRNAETELKAAIRDQKFWHIRVDSEVER